MNHAKIISTQITLEFTCISCDTRKHMTINEVPEVDTFGMMDVLLHCNRCGTTHTYRAERMGF